MGKYEELGLFLRAQRVQLVRMKFRDIEKLLGFPLPPSAQKHPEWWSNSGGRHVQSREWLVNGWKTEDVDLESRNVTFRRSASPEKRAEIAKAKRRDPFGCMAGTVTFMPGVDLTEPSEEWDAERETRDE